ncbi:MAG: hypothetical protein LBO06_05355 [Bacteroidales bacterium]|jgi:hypothetical protein|nr:hypothetical protein [Bacteroidales bacterium]
MKKSYLIIIIIALVALTTANVWLFFRSKSCCEQSCCANDESKCYLAKSLDLDTNQSQQYEAIKVKHQAIAAHLADSLHQSQDLLVDYIQQKEYNDDAILQLEEQIQYFQRLLLQQSVEQYYELKSILKSEQIPALDSLYRHILVCRPTCEAEVQHSNSHIHTNKAK